MLFTDSGRIVCVTVKGVFSKQYSINHAIDPENIKNVRIERGSFGTPSKLVVLSNNNGYETTYRYTVKDPENWERTINEELVKWRALDRLGDQRVDLINSQEKSTFDEILDLTKRSIAYKWLWEINDDAHLIPWLEANITAKRIEGFIDKKNRVFTHMDAYQQKTEVVHYNIATNFEFGEHGIVINCPFCGSKKPQTQRTNEIVCDNCGNTYVIPKKILDLI